MAIGHCPMLTLDTRYGDDIKMSEGNLVSLSVGWLMSYWPAGCGNDLL